MSDDVSMPLARLLSPTVKGGLRIVTCDKIRSQRNEHRSMVALIADEFTPLT